MGRRGIYKRDSGNILLDGKPIEFTNAKLKVSLLRYSSIASCGWQILFDVAF
jgi:hypothetical protein